MAESNASSLEDITEKNALIPSEITLGNEDSIDCKPVLHEMLTDKYLGIDKPSKWSTSLRPIISTYVPLYMSALKGASCALDVDLPYYWGATALTMFGSAAIESRHSVFDNRSTIRENMAYSLNAVENWRSDKKNEIYNWLCKEAKAWYRKEGIMDGIKGVTACSVGGFIIGYLSAKMFKYLSS